MPCENDTNLTPAMTRTPIRLISDYLNPEKDLAAAKFYSQEYDQAMAGDTAAQKWIKDALKEWAHPHRGAISGRSQIKGMMKDLQEINPRAAAAFNNAIISHDGSIEFTPHHHK